MPSQAVPVDYDPFASDPLAPQTFAQRNDPQAALARLDALALDPHAGETLTPYQPTWQDRLTTALIGPNTPAASERGQTIGKLMSLVGLTPVGAALATQAALQHGDYQGAALAGLGALPGAGVLERGTMSGERAATSGLADMLRGYGNGELSLESRSPRMYTVPDRPPRPFEADYPPDKWPNGPPVDDQGNLTHDIEGRPLGARYVVGRNVVGGADEALPTAEFNAFTEATTGQLPTRVAPSSIGGNAGRSTFARGTLKPEGLALSNKLTPDQAVRVFGHELGHMVDEMAGEIPTTGLMSQLKGNYNTLNNGARSADGLEAATWARPATPQDLRYKGDAIPREYMAEAIRAYLTNPNYLKAVAPRTAKAIRNAVNANPRFGLSGLIQFNSVAPLAAVGAAAAATGYSLVPVEGDPFAGQ